jgi:Tfp pilus assembly protein PilN
VVAANGVDRRQGELTAAQAELVTTQARAAALAPGRAYSAAVAERSARVKALADQRLRWERTLDELARALPSDARVKSIRTTPAATADAADAAAGAAPAAPTMVVGGCVPSQDGIPDLLSRLGDLRGATRAVLGTSRRSEDASSDDKTCPARAAVFEVTVSFGGWSAGA